MIPLGAYLITFLVASAVADVSIACALIVQLRSSKPVFKETKAYVVSFVKLFLR